MFDSNPWILAEGWVQLFLYRFCMWAYVDFFDRVEEQQLVDVLPLWEGFTSLNFFCFDLIGVQAGGVDKGRGQPPEGGVWALLIVDWLFSITVRR